MSTPSYLPYHEPSLTELLITSTFLLALNGINSVLDHTLACGLIGQVLVGTAWGSPGAGWLTPDFERVVFSLGYLGLILVVYAGGVETDVAALRKNIVLSVAVAITGVVVPIALSFALLATPGQFLGGDGGSGAGTLLPAFAAGAALCSTSLGTTFSVLQASGLSRTRLGAVLASAALLDDVVGLVMVRIITSLGNTGNSGIEPATILRPVLVSGAFAVAVPLVCRYVVRPGQRALDPIVQRWDSKEKEKKEGSASKKTKVAVWIHSQEAAFIVQTALLILLVVAADYAGASILLAAYLAGVVVSWWDGQRDGFEASSPDTHSAETSTPVEQQAQDPDRQELETTSDRSSSDANGQVTPEPPCAASRVFDSYYAQAVTRVLKPFFFASIGFSIPISRLFVGEIVWRGIIYSILMIIGKLVCGLWLVRFPVSMSGVLRSIACFIASKYSQTVSKIRSWRLRPTTKSHEAQSNQSPSTQTTCIELSTPQACVRLLPSESAPSPQNSTLATPPKPLSLYPAAVMGCAMVARGEIGFLISSMAESQGVFRRADEDASQASELFLIVTWAIFVCTILGPICTGLLVRRIKKLEKASEASRGGTRDVLGVWGVG
ncbi:Sodium/hydrogen exchanger family-domain-containing protein [Xylaria flabelliformis]|nr:Sodium/hydrogen exchanger family-domain-containing protein [Xylaria flabelliformis]